MKKEANFKAISPYKPAEDQPDAIKILSDSIKRWKPLLDTRRYYK